MRVCYRSVGDRLLFSNLESTTMVMEDHKKVGKKLIPAFLQDFPIEKTKWQTQRLPEVVWLGILCNRHGDQLSFEMMKEMTASIRAVVCSMRNSDHTIRPYIPSEHLTFSCIERDAICKGSSDSPWLKSIKPALQQMAAVWPTFPLSYLLGEDRGEFCRNFVREVKELLENCRHRYSKEALLLQTMFVALEIETGGLYLAKEISPPDLNSIFDYPDTEESQKAAGFVVTTFNSTIMMRSILGQESQFDWPRKFWNTCHKLEPCEHD